MFNFIKNISPTEWIIIVFILVVLFGGKVMKALGRTSGETLKEIKGIKKTFTDAIEGKESTDSKEVPK